MPEVAIIAALEREIGPLIRRWKRTAAKHGARAYRFFSDGGMVAVAGGIGPEAAYAAAQAVVSLYRPGLLISAGFAGALAPGTQASSIYSPYKIVDASSGRTYDAGGASGVLVTAAQVLSAAQKLELRRRYHADAVDMEAAAVARVAQEHGLRFAAVKAIHDDSQLSLPDFARFIDPEGHFRTSQYLAHIVLRPWTWPLVWRMGVNSAQAARVLSAQLASRDFLGVEPDPTAALGTGSRLTH